MRSDELSRARHTRRAITALAGASALTLAGHALGHAGLVVAVFDLATLKEAWQRWVEP